MPKPMYVWSGTAWVSVATEVESLATYATQSYANNAADVASGLKPIVPTSVTIGSGSSSVSTLGQVTFTGASSVSLNGVFSTIYDNYKILVDISSFSTTATTLNLRMRVSGADNTDAQNYAAGINPMYLTTTYPAYNSNAQTTWRLATNPAGSGSAIDGFIELYNPFLASITKLDTMFATASDAIVHRIGGIHNVASSFTGFTLYPTGGNITGTVSVYGYKK